MGKLHIISADERVLLNSIVDWAQNDSCCIFDFQHIRAYIESALIEYTFNRTIMSYFDKIDLAQIAFKNDKTQDASRIYLKEKLSTFLGSTPPETIPKNSIVYFLLEKFKVAHKNGDIYAKYDPHPNAFLPTVNELRCYYVSQSIFSRVKNKIFYPQCNVQTIIQDLQTRSDKAFETAITPAEIGKAENSASTKTLKHFGLFREKLKMDIEMSHFIPFIARNRDEAVSIQKPK
ncbi:MAG: hypothetical protein NTW08_05005 [Gammaproteobacteria bacterium]|nr:hypothetical protein [Gammaproteobacteria bacterium]